MKILAHRGASAYAPENTLAAINMALFEMPCEGIEIDVHFSKDGKLVVIHDDTIDRTTDSKGNVKDYTYEELLRFNAFGKFRDKYPTEKIPTLDEVLELIKKSGKMINIEIKNGSDFYPGIEEAVIEKVFEYGLAKETLLSSFDHKAVKKCKEITKDIRTGLLCHKKVENPLEYGKKHNADAYNYRYICLTRKYVNELRSYGYEVNCYTPNAKIEINYMIHAGVDTIITNFPDRADMLMRKRR